MTRWFILWLMLLGSVAVAPLHRAGEAAESALQTTPPLKGPELEARVSELIERLGDDNYQVRVQARWELERIGLAAFGQLREAVSHPKIQIATAARYLVQSQNVIWWLPSDSASVRRLLADYNALSEVERDTRLQELARHGTEDAVLALCRLARFESNESLSKSAALHLMEKVSAAPLDANLPRSIAVTVEDDERVAAQWLRALAADLVEGGAQVDRWRTFAAQEAVAASAEQPPAGPRRRPVAETNQSALRFYKWIGKWLTERVDRLQALQTVEQSLSLVAPNPYAYLEYCKWATDAQLPELVVELAKQHAETFKQEPQLGFLLAECYLSIGEESAAEQTAQAASEQIALSAERVPQIAATMNVQDIIANRRSIIALQLSERGLFPWAEREFQKATELENSPRVEATVRGLLGEFYWAGGDFDKAAEALRPLFESPLSAAESGLPGRASELAELAPYYYFYQGLAATEQGNKALASELLVKAVETGELSQAQPNPDIVIAMQRIADNEERQQLFQDHFDAMLRDFRARVIAGEQELAKSPDRSRRAYAGVELASACNQLAWLLSKCEMNGEEAVNLSRRSLEFRPDEPSLLDTLGRCHFAAGNLREAVAVQEKAVASAPHDRQMQVQLAEFQAALAEQQSASASEPTP